MLVKREKYIFQYFLPLLKYRKIYFIYCIFFQKNNWKFNFFSVFLAEEENTGKYIFPVIFPQEENVNFMDCTAEINTKSD